MFRGSMKLLPLVVVTGVVCCATPGSAFQSVRHFAAAPRSVKKHALQAVPAPHFSENNRDSGSNASPAASDASLFKLIDNAGQGLKPAAAQANAKAALTERRPQKFIYMLKSCVLYSAFIVYRAYRGLFVILPAVFRETFRKLQVAVDDAPFDEESANADIVFEAQQLQQQPPMKLRTRVTVSVLAAIVTVSYVVGGALRVAAALIRHVAKKGEVTQSFAAAATEQERNENSILRRTRRKNDARDINGQEKGLAP